MASKPTNGAIETLTLPGDVAAAVEAERRRLRADGLPETWATLGLLYADQYFTVHRDPVRFPDGKLGTYVRIDVRDRGPGAAVLAMHKGRVALLRHFRHATQSWHLEIPRGFGEAAASAEESARREVREELGCEVLTLEPLGVMHVNTGLSSECVSLFVADCSEPRTVDAGEGIAEAVLMTRDDFARMIATGEITDSFTLCAYARATASGLLTMKEP